MRRIKILNLGFCLIVLFIVFRLFYWQIVMGGSLSAMAESQYQVEQEVPSSRGQIFSMDGFPLVGNKEIYNVFINNQRNYSLTKETAFKLAKILVKEEAQIPETENEIYDKFNNHQVVWTYLSKSIEEEQKNQIKQLNIKGLDFENEENRFYPEGSMSAHLLGFLGKDSLGRNQGYFGIEGYYDRELKGISGIKRSEQDALGVSIPIGNKVEDKMSQGRDLTLYLDRGIQFMIEEKLKLAIQKYGAKSGSVTIMDPKTGGILADASYPSFTPTSYYQEEKTLFSNPIVSQTFEPGSIFKVLVMSAGINEGLIKPEDKCTFCTGPKQIGEYAVRTWDDKYYPNSTMTEVLQHSDNVGMVYVSERLGKKKLFDNLTNFGIGSLTGIDLEGETNVPLRPYSQWADIDSATISFGQGVAVTSIEMLTAVSAIANGGKLLEPHVVYKISDSDREIEIKPKIVGNPITETTAKVVTEMMIKATQYGEAKWAVPKGYRIAGKTGTAQIPIAGHYEKNKTIASFVGFAPADDPKFAMLVTLKEPATSQWGSETAAPLWFDICKEIFKIRGIPPD